MNYNDPKNQIALDYADLGDEETSSGQVCPSCKGGTSEEKSLSVTRRGGLLLYRCHRASCSFKGSVGTGSGYFAVGTGKKAESSEVDITETAITKATAKFLAARYGLTDEAVEYASIRWTGDGPGHYERRLSFPIFRPSGKQRGTNYRSYEGAKPKALIRLNSADEVGLAWYRYLRKSDTLVLVEDQVSAIRLAPYVDACALLGTHISDAKADEIIQQKYKRVFLSLDADATSTAIKMQLLWRNRIKNMYVLGIHKDIKDMNKEDFEEYIERLQLEES